MVCKLRVQDDEIKFCHEKMKDFQAELGQKEEEVNHRKNLLDQKKTRREKRLLGRRKKGPVTKMMPPAS